MTFVQALRVLNRSIPIREVFSSKLRDLIKLLIKTKLFLAYFLCITVKFKKVYWETFLFLNYIVYFPLSGGLAI